jgi:hypothetical protein
VPLPAAAEQLLHEGIEHRLKALEEGEDQLPDHLGLEAGAAGYIAEVLAMMRPHLYGLVEAALARLPAGRRAIVLAQDLAAAERGLGEAQAEQKKGEDLLYVLLGLQDEHTHAFVSERAYEAGSACTLLGGTCTQLQKVEELVDDVNVMPQLIQEDVADCFYTPICGSAERKGIEEYIGEQVKVGRETYETTTVLGAFMQFDSELASESWIEAFSEA